MEQLRRIAVVAAAAVTIGGGGTASAQTLKLDNLRLLVTRFDETFLFYRDVLGLKATWGHVGENYASFTFADGAGLGLFKRSLMAEAVGTSTMPATRQEQDTVALVLTVDDVDATYQRLRARGVQFVSAPQNRDVRGIRAAHFRDPDGNLIEVFSALKR